MKFYSPKLWRMIALAGIFQSGCLSSPQPVNENLLALSEQVLSMDNLTAKEKDSLRSFIDDSSAKSSAARKIFQELAKQNTRIYLFNSDLGAGNIFHAGLSDENTLGLNRQITEQGFSFGDIFFHEAEHVVHLKRSHKNGINAHSFSSLNDVYIYATLLEALAYRKAALCCAECQQLPREKVKQLADEAFKNRLLTSGKYMEERLTYERDAIVMANSETNTLPNQIYFKKKPNWNKIVSVLSRGEVKEIPHLPQPTLLFLSACLYKELEKNPKARSLNDLDISCVLTNQSKLQKDTKEIKALISTLLIEVYDICQKSKKKLSDNAMYSFLYAIGWPTKDQQKQIDKGETDFENVRDINLSKFKTEKLFDMAMTLLNSKEVQSYKIPKLEIYRKVLKFEKMILIPNKSQGKMKQQSTR